MFCSIHNMPKAQKTFGSAKSTGVKLDLIEKYLSMYQTALGNKFSTLYIDGFAGTGEVPIEERERDLFGDEEERLILKGSADRAFRITPPFSRYIFIDKRKKCIDELKLRFAGFALKERIEYVVDSADKAIRTICANQSGRWQSQRGVVLLDPFGSDVSFDTIRAIASTEALDLWYLFPAGVSVFRQMGYFVEKPRPISRQIMIHWL